MSEELTKALEVISRETMEQYETVKQEGPCNMLDYPCVVKFAGRTELYALGSLTHDEYYLIIANFGGLMKHYGIMKEANNGEKSRLSDSDDATVGSGGSGVRVAGSAGIGEVTG